MSKLTVWRNTTKATYFGRPQSISNLKLPLEVCPHVAPGGKPLALGPGDEFHDDRGVISLALNANDAQFTILVFGRGDDVEHDLAKLGQERVLKALAVPPVQVKDSKTGQPTTLIGYVLKGMRGCVEDVTHEYQAGINLSGNRLAAAKELEALSSAVEEKDSIIAALKAELEKAKKGVAKEEKKQSAVREALSSVGAPVGAAVKG